MTANELIAVVAGVAAVAGAYISGRQTGKLQEQAINALKVTVDEQKRIIDTIPAMRERITVLESLVTQRANVEHVIEVVEEIREKVNEAPWLT
jgi:hypothetical protein